MRCHEYDCYNTDSSNYQIKPHKEWEAHPNRGDESEHEHLMPFMHQHCALGPERPKCTELWRSCLTNTSLLQSQGIFTALTTENWKSYKEFESVPQASTPLWGNLRNCKCCLVETHTSWWCHKGRPHTSHTPHISTHCLLMELPILLPQETAEQGEQGPHLGPFSLRIIPQGSFLSASFCIDCQDTQHRRSHQGSHARDLRTNINGFTIGYFGYCWVILQAIVNRFCFVNRFYLTARWIVII